MTYVCYQGNDRDCGFASLKMLLANKTHNKKYLYLKKPSKKKDYTFYDLMYIAKNYGFVLSAYEMPIDDFKEIPLGTLVMIKPNHLVYLKRVGKFSVTYIDPNIGKVRVSHDEFMKRWSGQVLECVNTKDAKECKAKKNKLLPIWMDLIYYGILSIVFASLLTGFYLIKDDSSIILTMGFLLLFALAELVENWYIVKELNFFDRQYIDIFFSQKSNQNIEAYRSYVDYKCNYFISFKTLISNLVMIIVFATLLCVNDYRNLLVFLILLLVKVLDAKLLSKKEKQEAKEVDDIEKTAFDSPSTLTASLKKANSLAGKVALTVSLKKVFYIFVSLCLALGMMIVNNMTSTNFIIFHLGIYFLMSEAFGHLIRYFSNFRERKIKRSRFLDRCDL